MHRSDVYGALHEIERQAKLLASGQAPADVVAASLLREVTGLRATGALPEKAPLIAGSHFGGHGLCPASKISTADRAAGEKCIMQAHASKGEQEIQSGNGDEHTESQYSKEEDTLSQDITDFSALDGEGEETSLALLAQIAEEEAEACRLQAQSEHLLNKHRRMNEQVAELQSNIEMTSTEVAVVETANKRLMQELEDFNPRLRTAMHELDTIMEEIEGALAKQPHASARLSNLRAEAGHLKQFALRSAVTALPLSRGQDACSSASAELASTSATDIADMARRSAALESVGTLLDMHVQENAPPQGMPTAVVCVSAKAPRCTSTAPCSTAVSSTAASTETPVSPATSSERRTQIEEGSVNGEVRGGSAGMDVCATREAWSAEEQPYMRTALATPTCTPPGTPPDTQRADPLGTPVQDKRLALSAASPASLFGTISGTDTSQCTTAGTMPGTWRMLINTLNSTPTRTPPTSNSDSPATQAATAEGDDRQNGEQASPATTLPGTPRCIAEASAAVNYAAVRCWSGSVEGSQATLCPADAAPMGSSGSSSVEGSRATVFPADVAPTSTCSLASPVPPTPASVASAGPPTPGVEVTSAHRQALAPVRCGPPRSVNREVVSPTPCPSRRINSPLCSHPAARSTRATLPVSWRPPLVSKSSSNLANIEAGVHGQKIQPRRNSLSPIPCSGHTQSFEPVLGQRLSTQTPKRYTDSSPARKATAPQWSEVSMAAANAAGVAPAAPQSSNSLGRRSISPPLPRSTGNRMMRSASPCKAGPVAAAMRVQSPSTSVGHDGRNLTPARGSPVTTVRSAGASHERASAQKPASACSFVGQPPQPLQSQKQQVGASHNRSPARKWMGGGSAHLPVGGQPKAAVQQHQQVESGLPSFSVARTPPVPIAVKSCVQESGLASSTMPGTCPPRPVGPARPSR
mmetsp:Transcript_90516/g.156952  ORF Transcript_90516/g.156952 Transcript_90516/m.156952 type:complete len:924 (+) Transcript_90516:66-2837(+)